MDCWLFISVVEWILKSRINLIKTSPNMSRYLIVANSDSVFSSSEWLIIKSLVTKKHFLLLIVSNFERFQLSWQTLCFSFILLFTLFFPASTGRKSAITLNISLNWRNCLVADKTWQFHKHIQNIEIDWIDFNWPLENTFCDCYQNGKLSSERRRGRQRKNMFASCRHWYSCIIERWSDYTYNALTLLRL